MIIKLKSYSKEDIIDFLNQNSKLNNNQIQKNVSNSDISLVNFLINLKETNLYPMSKELTKEMFKSDLFNPTTIFTNAFIGFLNNTIKTKIHFMDDYKTFLKMWIELNPEKAKVIIPFLFNISMQTFIKEEIKDVLTSYLENENNPIPFTYLKLDKKPKDYFKINFNYLKNISEEIRNSRNITELSVNLFGKNSKALRKIIDKYILINEDLNYDFFLLTYISKKLNYSTDQIISLFENYDFDYFFNKNKYTNLTQNKKVLTFLLDNFPKRIPLILNSSIENRHVIELEEMLKHTDIHYQLPIKPKNFLEIHNELNYQYRIKEQPNHKLNQEDIFSWEKDILNSYDGEYTIFIPKNNHDLIYSGYKMINCVGNGDYAPDLEKGISQIFFLKKDNKFQVCVFLNKKKLHSAKGKRNSNINEILMLDIKRYLLTKEER